MKKIFLAVGVAMTALLYSCGGSTSAPKNFSDSLSAAIGAHQGSETASSFQNADPELLKKVTKADYLRGLKDALTVDSTSIGYLYGVQQSASLVSMLIAMEADGLTINRQLIYDEFAKALNSDSVNTTQTYAELQTLIARAQALVQQKNQAETDDRMAKQEEFFANIKKDPSVKTTESGLAYKVIKQGTGETPAAGDNVGLSYTGRLYDGTVFDSSEDNVVTFTPEQTVPGFCEALMLMNPGSEYEVYIPAELGYGARPKGSIPANSLLVFNIKVDNIKKN